MHRLAPSLLLFCLILGGLQRTASATTYYVDASSGSDNNGGTSDSTAWKTIAKVNGKRFLPGDFILFKRGETWREQLTVSGSGSAASPITYGAYGSGAKPVITGADPVSGWTLYSGNIYVAHVSRGTRPTQLYLDGAYYDVAHYPNSGYLLSTGDASNTTSVVDAKLTLAASQIVGATVSTRAQAWRITTNTATAYDATSHTISLSGEVYNQSVKMGSGWGFYLSNLLWMLDSPGEWFLDTNSGKLYLWPPAGDTPARHAVEISNRSYGIVCSEKQYVTIQDLAVQNADQYNLRLVDSGHVTARRLDVSGAILGIYLSGTPNVTLEQNSVQSPLASGIYMESGTGISNAVVSDNIVSNAGNVGSMPKQSNAGIFADCTGSTIKNNSVSNSGYNGIEFHGYQNTVHNNVIDRSCLVLDDCGGIYTVPYGYSDTTNRILGNVITNAQGNRNGTPYSYTQAQGIYLDHAATNDTSNCTLSGNTTSNTDFGIYLHKGHNNIVSGNRLYGARSFALLIEEDSPTGGGVYGDQVNANVFETTAAQAPVCYTSSVQSSVNFGSYNGNYYCHPHSNYAVKNQSTSYDLLKWRAFSGQDLDSTEAKALCSVPAPALTLTPGTAPDGTTLLNWSSTNATSCTAGGAWSGAVPLSSSWPVYHSGNYHLTCSGRGGSVTRSVTVTVR